MMSQQNKLDVKYSFQSLMPNITKRIQQCISDLINEHIIVKIKDIFKLKPELSATLCRKEETVIIYSYIVFDERYQGLIALDINAAKRIVKLLLNMAEIDLTEDNALDALKEFGNIVFGSLASEVSKKLNTKVNYSIPQVVVELCSAVISSLAAEMCTHNDLIDVFKLEFISKNESINMIILLFKEGVLC